MTLQKMPASFEVVQGLWNPAKESFSWITVDSFDNLNDARNEIDLIIASGMTGEEVASFASKAKMREAHKGPPLAVLEVRRKVVDRIAGEVPQFAAA